MKILNRSYKIIFRRYGYKEYKKSKNVPNTLVLKLIKKFGIIVKDNLIKS